MTAPRVLLFDIETAPNLGWVWAKYEQNVIEYQSEWYLLCFSYKWLGEGRAKCVSLPDFPKEYKADPEDDSRLAAALWALLDEADIAIGHNGDRFDIRKANARFIAHGMTPPSHYRTVDTLKAARRYFMFNSNSLGDLGQHLGLGAKVSTGGFGLWAGCMRGDAKAWGKMVRYAKQDVDLLEKVYLRLRPWIRNHPNVSVFDGSTKCPSCGSANIRRRGVRSTNTMVFVQFRCSDCGAWSRARKSSFGERPGVVS